mgnify:CR=1 FL=1
MEKYDLMKSLSDSIEKARRGEPVGTIKQWGGKTYIKTPSGWKPKGELRNPKPEDKPVHQMPKKPEEIKPERKKKEEIASYAKRATDNQLEAASKDPKAAPAVKAAAQQELASRNKAGEPTEQKKETKRENENKTVDKKLDQLKEDIIKELDERLPKKKEESVTSTFKGEVKEAYDKAMAGETSLLKLMQVMQKNGYSMDDIKKFLEEDKKSRGKDTNTSKSSAPPSTPKKEEKPNNNFSSLGEARKYQRQRNRRLRDEFRSRIKELRNYLPNKEEDAVTDAIGKILSKEDPDFVDVMDWYGDSDFRDRLTINELLMDKGYMPVVNGIMFHEFRGNKYLHFDANGAEYAKAKTFYDSTNNINSQDTDDQTRIDIDYYTGKGYSRIRSYNNNPDSIEGINKQIVAKRADNIANFIDKNPMKDYVILTRRMSFGSSSNGNNLKDYVNAEAGDIIEDKSFVSFSLQQLSGFGGDMQVTLLAKPGDKIANIGNSFEQEFLAQRGSKFKVIESGTNSIVVEMI